MDRAKALADDLDPAPIAVTSLEERALLPELQRSSILINATSLGWHPGEAPLPLDWLAALP
ncbi:MAG: shikimate dehydrogenase, partial [Chloroflexota bacterium]